jgi:hypothetical protein
MHIAGLFTLIIWLLVSIIPEVTSWKRNVKNEDAKSKKTTGNEPRNEKGGVNTTGMSIGGHEVLHVLVEMQPMTAVEIRNTATRWVTTATTTTTTITTGTAIDRGVEQGEGDIDNHDRLWA